MLACVEDILQFTQGLSKDQFLADLKTIRATAFEVGMLGEAAKFIPDEIKARYADIPWRSIIAVRNIIVHEYFRIDEEILWQTVNEDILPLREKLKRILETGHQE
jgi:uncharacterized protein with HEPN domain